MIKQPTTYEQQIEILERHGCIVEDKDFCKCILESVNYYRLSAYFLPFRIANNKYNSVIKFEDIYKIYEFDRKLRGIIFTAVEYIEVYLRSIIAYYHAHKYGALGYMNPDNYNSKHNHERFTAQIKFEINRHNKKLFVKHHIENYNGEFPIWVIIEIFTFGMLSYFYGDLQASDQKELSKSLNINYKNMISWLRCCTDIRNICAHYERLYYRIFSSAPANLSTICSGKERTLFGALFALSKLFPDKDNWNNEILVALSALIENYIDIVNLSHIGFPDNWEEILKR